MHTRPVRALVAVAPVSQKVLFGACRRSLYVTYTSARAKSMTHMPWTRTAAAGKRHAVHEYVPSTDALLQVNSFPMAYGASHVAMNDVGDSSIGLSSHERVSEIHAMTVCVAPKGSAINRAMATG